MKKYIIIFLLLSYMPSLKAQYFPSFDDTINTNSNVGMYQYAFATDSFYYVVGSYYTIFFNKYDLSGNLVQTKNTTINAGLDDMKYDQEVKMLDDKFIVAAADYSSPYKSKIPMLAAFDFNFDTLWVWRYDSSFFLANTPITTFTDVVTTPDGGYIVSGHHRGNSLNSIAIPFLMKLSATGAKQWLKYYQHSGTICNLKLTPDKGIIFYSTHNGGRIVKANALGSILWQFDILGRTGLYEACDLIYSGGQTFALGRSQRYEASTDPYYSNYGLNLIKVNYITGQILIDTFYMPLNSIALHGGGLQLHLLDNDVLMVSATGYSNLTNSGLFSNIEGTSRAGLAFYSSNGDSLTTITHIFGPQNLREVTLSGLAMTPDGGFFGTGSLNIWGDGWCKSFGWAFKIGGTGYVAEILESLKNESARIYPNPARESIIVGLSQPPKSNVNIQLFNSLGKLVKTAQIPEGTKEFHLNISSLLPGMYFYQIHEKNGQSFVSGKLIKE